MKTLIKNARLVLPDRVAAGSLLVDGGTIAAVGPVPARGADAIHDCGGRWLLPGLVDLHCDVIERDYEPRRDATLPMELAVREADRRNAAAGVTTQFHGVAFGHAERGLRDDAAAEALARTIAAEAPGLLVDNRVLLRVELAAPASCARVAALVGEGIGDLASLMDHQPGAAGYASLVAAWRAGRAEGDPAYAAVAALAAACRRRGLALGSHDDDSAERIDFLAAHGFGLSEFPKDLATARAAVGRGLATVVGGPNAVRGRSHLNLLAAADAVAAGCAGAVCSDYHPTILPQALAALSRAGEGDMPAVAALFTRGPALAAGLADRGALAVGLRADLLELAFDGQGWARIVSCWSRGRLVAHFPAAAAAAGAPTSNAHQKIMRENRSVIRA